MTAFSITTDTNYDSLSTGSTNATLDSYTIGANATLTVDTDSYQCAGHSTARGSLDNIQFSGLGGRVLIDGSNVRVIPYNTGTGNVPAIGTTISQGGVSATLLGVWADWLSEPTAAAAAMPASGYIKVKGKTGGSFAAGALTGIGASATGADVVGWIEVRGPDTGQITVSRLGKFEVNGEWFELGTTNGSAGQVIPCPIAATVAGTIPGVQVETGVGTGVYEWYHGMGTRGADSTLPTDSTRGKFFWHTTAGLRFGSDGTNNVGYVPASGCRVRIPNVFLTTCTRTGGSGSGPRVLPNATLGTRHEFITTGAGVIDLDKCVMQWYANFSQAYSFSAENVAINDTWAMSELATPMNVKFMCVSPTQQQVNLAANLSSIFQGGVFEDNTFIRYSMSNANTGNSEFLGVHDLDVKRTKFGTCTNRTSGSSSVFQATACQRLTLTTPTQIGGRLFFTACLEPKVYTPVYCDQLGGLTNTSQTHPAVEFTNSFDVFGYGLTLPVTNCHPYEGAYKGTRVEGGLIYGVGTYASPLDCGSTNAMNYAWASGGANSAIKVARCYLSNTRTGVQNNRNNDYGCIVENCAGDYADTNGISGSNLKYRGVANAAPSAGGTAIYGTHFADEFTSTTAGMLIVMMNEPTDESAAQCAITSGSAVFNSAGQVSLAAVGDQLSLEMAWFVKGHTAFANTAPTLTGTNTGNLTYEYQVDLGSGYGGSWKTLNAANLSGEGAIDPAVGFRMKLRITCATASTLNQLTQIKVITVTTSTAQSTNLYDLLPVPVTITNVVSGSRILIRRTDTSAVVYNGIVSGTTFSQEFDLIGIPISVELRKASGSPYYQPFSTSGTVTTTGFSATALQVRDDQ